MGRSDRIHRPHCPGLDPRFLLGRSFRKGALISSFVSYAMEKKLSKIPEKFGQGAIAGVAGPETANNSATGGAFTPLLTLGLPSNIVMAMLLAARGDWSLDSVHHLSPTALDREEKTSHRKIATRRKEVIK